MYINQRAFNIALAKLEIPGIAVAKELGIHHTTLSRWVRRWYPVPDHYRPKLAEILEIKVSELFESENADE